MSGAHLTSGPVCLTPRLPSDSPRAPRPENETERLQALHRLELIDTPEDPSFDRLTRMAARLFGVETALISLVDDRRQWFKSHVGTDLCETCREDAFCSRTILGEDALVVLDARADARFADNPLVVGPPWIRFYAGVPVRSPDGYRIGSLCLIDTEPRANFRHEDQRMLRDLAEMVEEQIERTHVHRTEIAVRDASLHELGCHMDAVMRASPLATMTVSHDRVTGWNPAAERMFGWRAGEIMHRPLPYVPTDRQDEHRSLVERVRAGEAVHGHETRRLHRDGHEIDVAIWISPMQDAEGQYRASLVLIEDITERKAAEQRQNAVMTELRDARDAARAGEAAKAQFLANMSHELRSPLNAIIGFGEILEMRGGPADDTDKRVGYAGDVVASGRHLLGVINDVLDTMKADRDRQKINYEKVDLHELIDEALRMLGPAAQQYGVALSRSFASDRSAARADRTKVRQVLLNVISNAAKFSHAGGIVSVATVDTPAGLEIRVADQGIGMDSDGIRVALEPFGQVDAGLDRRRDGTGLGLPLARDFMQAHGGDLRIESTPRGGTTVHLTFPSAPAAA